MLIVADDKHPGKALPLFSMSECNSVPTPMVSEIDVKEDSPDDMELM